METRKSLDISEITIEQVQEGYASKRFSCVELTQAFIDRINLYNNQYNAIIFLNITNALEEAERIDSLLSTGQNLGPLAGVPIVVKDAMDMVGFPTTGGWSLLHSKCGGVDLMPSRDSPVVERMKKAGAIILGKTNM